MDLKALVVVFATVFLAELGDKTQLATVLFAARSPQRAWFVFVAASLALVCAAGIGGAECATGRGKARCRCRGDGSDGAPGQ